MANLLDQASIVLTPTAYDNGKVLCAKPSEPPYGDFDFSRNSAATRVNAQGLVENVQILSSNLVQNGDFSEEGAEEVSNGSFSQEGVEQVTNGNFDTDSDWNLGSGINISGGSVNFTGIPNANINQNAGLTTGKTYKIVFTISNYVSGNIDYNVGGATRRGEVSGNGTYTDYVVSNTGQLLYFQSDQILGFTGSIDNVSVREVAQNWTLGTGWSIGEDKAISDGTTSNLDQFSTSIIGKSYKVALTVNNITTGALSVRLGSTSSSQVINITSNGTYIAYGVAETTYLRLRSQSGFDGSVTNISVKEVGQNWDLNTGWEIGDGVAVATSGAASKLTQSISGLSGKKCSVTFTLSNYGGNGTIKLDFGSVVGQNINANGTYTEVGTYDIDRFEFFKNSSFSGSITNISVIEITDDTNLPRINYEGFSYQDALGSELVVNGDGSSTIGWNVAYPNTTLSINNNNLRATANASGAYGLSQILSLDTSKQYLIKATINVDNASGGTGNFRIATSQNLGVNATTLSDTTGTSTTIFTPSASTMYIGVVDTANNSSNYVEIDNVSVKEYLGQEVVPDSGCGSWLFEPQSTNLFLKSEPTSAEGLSIGVSYESFDWGIGFDNCVRYPNNSTLYVHYGGTCLASTSYTLSYYIKMDNGEQPIYGTDFSHRIGDTLGTSPILTNMGNGVYRVSETKISSTSNLTRNGVIKDTNFSANGFRVTALQIEQQSYATSYIPTSGSTVTRNQDVCTNGGSLASINSTEGVLYAEIAALTKINPSGNITLTDGTGNNRIYIYYLIDNSISVIYNVNSTGASINNFSLANITDQTKIAVRWGNSNVSVWINGASVLSNTTSNFLPNTLNVLNFSKPAGSGNFFGKTKALAVWKEALSDSELQSLTTI